MTQSVMPFLMFEGRAEEAMKFYASVFPDTEILELERFGSRNPAAEQSIYKGILRVAGQTVRCFDSPAKHGFTFTPAFSFFVTCDSEDELRRIAAPLLEGGKAHMPVNNYGFSQLFAWIDDRFGVSWQLNLPA